MSLRGANREYVAQSRVPKKIRYLDQSLPRGEAGESLNSRAAMLFFYLDWRSQISFEP